MSTVERQYQSGFGNEFATEALPGALPQEQYSPQKPRYGLYAEQFTGTPFTAPREVNRWTWVYRIRPSAMHKPFREIAAGLIRSGPFHEAVAPPNQLRWKPLPIPEKPTDFLEGIATLGGNGDPSLQSGAAIHLYAANASMRDRFFYNADGETLVVPQMGGLIFHTELGILHVEPNELCVIPRGIRFRVELTADSARGYICENYGPHFRLPELGPIGTQGLANSRDFLSPAASFEEREGHFQLIAKFLGRLWEAEIDHSPLDVVAWHGTFAPYKYDLLRFNCINTVTYGHPDPSIYCVLAAPTATPGFSNVEVGCFPPRWTVANDTFRPPPFHRNISSEFMGLIRGDYIGKREGFIPGSASLHNCMAGHGPDNDAYERGRSAESKPQYLADTLAFLFETQLVVKPTKFALEAEILERDYYQHWQGIQKRFRTEEEKAAQPALSAGSKP